MSARHSKQSQSPMPTMVAYGQQAYAVTIQPMPGNMGPVQVIPAHPQAQTVVVNTTPVAFPTTQHQGHPMNTRSSSKNHTSQPHVVPAPVNIEFLLELQPRPRISYDFIIRDNVRIRLLQLRKI
ncbi:hypothetical protein FRC16_001766 [Serendipita sp. 398]|nr:hypothetical protein FRC16_001766 [Serendipita sp. 398]